MAGNSSIFNSELIKFVKKVLLVILLVIAADRITGSVLKYIYRHQNSGYTQKLTYVIDHCRDGIIIIGNSRALHHYKPDIIEKQTDLRCFNAGLAGQSLLYYQAITVSVLKRYTPKLVIIDLQPEDLLENKQFKAALCRLQPYYGDHCELRNILGKRSTFEKIYFCSSVYPYNSTILSITEKFLHKGKTGNGYEPRTSKLDTCIINRVRNKKTLQLHSTEKAIDPSFIQALKSSIDILRSRNVPVMVVISPLWRFSSNTNLMHELEVILNNHNIKIFNMQSTFNASPHFFSDEFHLNDSGATEFSGIINKQILNFLDCKNNVDPLQSNDKK